MLQLLRRVADEFDVAILMATHSVESTAVVDRVVRMRDGHIASIDIPAGVAAR